MPSILHDITPADLGLPAKFNSWRPKQDEIVLELTNCESKHLTQLVPAGGGKSINYTAAAVMLGGRTEILTHTKALQSQLLKDFGGDPVNMVDIRGKNNYPCAHNSHNLTCEQAWLKCPYHSAKPEEMGTNCTYQIQLVKARKASIVTTNYSMHMAINAFGEGLGEFDRIVLDEGHEAVEAIADFLSTELSIREIAEDLETTSYPNEHSPLQDWMKFAKEKYGKISGYVEDAVLTIKMDPSQADDNDLKQLSKLKDLARRLSVIATLDPHNWVVDTTKTGFRFDPIWPAQYAESILFRGIPFRILTSATIRPKTLQLLGINNKDPLNSRFSEYPSAFNPSRSPFYYVAGAPNMSYASTKKDFTTLRSWASRIDDIIRGRLDRKGIAHTVSFDLLRSLTSLSDYRHLIQTNEAIYGAEGRKTVEVIELFKASQPPSILASPSIATGFDFPGRDCEYQILCKLPYPPATSKVAIARKERDPEYYDYQTAQIITQACGRGVRSEDDWCENFIVDDRIRWFMGKNRHLFPNYFMRHWKSVLMIPPAPPRVPEKKVA